VDRGLIVTVASGDHNDGCRNIKGVAKPDVFARVTDDLAHGHTHVAIQRLRTLLATQPQDLEVRRALASIYRRIGNLSEAGRWAYLSDDLRSEEITAFERANPSPWLQLRLLQFTADPAILSDAARARLMELAAQAQRVGPPSIWTGPSTLERLPRRRNMFPCLFVFIALSAFAVLTAIGVYRAVVWFAQF
jgi:hypothetical protein